MNKNKLSDVLGISNDPETWTHESWVSAITNHYTHERTEMEQAIKDGRLTLARQHMATASALASILTLYFRVIGDQGVADKWTLRAQRYYDRAYRRNNALVKSLGAEMP